MNEREKTASINYILARGLVKPPTTTERIREMTRVLGLRFIFWDTGYSLCFATITVIGVLMLLILPSTSYRCSAAVAAAPLLFLVIALFAETTERASGLYELKATCRYTVRQITALRMICYSVVGVILTALIAALSAQDAREFLSLFPLCLFALFVCAASNLTITRLLRGKWTNAAFFTLWVLVSLALPLSFGENWETLLNGIPAVVSTSLALVCAGILVRQIGALLSEVKRHAVA
jgi:hypothetical protein